MECLKCSEKIDKKYTAIPMYEEWCSKCIDKYDIKSYEQYWNTWINNKSTSEIDRLIEKYAVSNNKIPDDGGYIKCPKNKEEKYMTRYEFYDYERLVKHWEQTEKYVCSYNILRIILPCFYCGTKCTPITRKIFNLTKMSFKCACGRKSGMKTSFGFSEGTLQCECVDVVNSFTNKRFNIEYNIAKNKRNNLPFDELNEELDIIKKNNHDNKFICDKVGYNDDVYVCSSHDSTDLVVLPKKPERSTFVRGLTSKDIEESSPNLLKYYDEDDYFMSYIFTCLHCIKTYSFRGDHVAFEIGDVFKCQYCQNPYTYIKISNKEPAHLPKEYQFIIDKVNKKLKNINTKYKT